MTLVHQGKLDLVTLISKLTCEPASILRRTDLGTLKPGAVADVVIFDPNKEWVVNPEEFISKGKNTPLAGCVLKGKVMAALFGGEVVYKDESVKLEPASKKMGVKGG
jgi:dihydroorotase